MLRLYDFFVEKLFILTQKYANNSLRKSPLITTKSRVMRPYDVFAKRFRTKINQQKKIGLEIEIPIVTHTGEAVNYSIIRKLFLFLEKKGFQLKKENQQVYEALIYSDIVKDYPITITTDLGFSTLEIILPPCNHLHDVDQCFKITIEYLLPFVKQQNCRLLGYGIHPFAQPSKRLLAPKQRYRALEKIWNTNTIVPKPMGNDGHLLTISAGNQCHIDVSETEAIQAANVLNASSGLQIALQANSPIWQGKRAKSYKAVREIFYDFICANAKKRYGIPPKFETLRGYFQFICDQKLFLIARNNEILQVSDYSFTEYIKQEKVTVSRLNGEKITIVPDIEDLYYHSTLFYLNARLVPNYGTIEVRMPCQQPPKDTMVTAALNLGLMENLAEAESLFNQYDHTVWQELRLAATKHGFQARLSNGKSIIPLIEQLLAIAQKGLESRGLGESHFLQPLFKRLDQQQSPADVAIEIFNKKGINGLLDAVSFTEETLTNRTNQAIRQPLYN